MQKKIPHHYTEIWCLGSWFNMCVSQMCSRWTLLHSWSRLLSSSFPSCVWRLCVWQWVCLPASSHMFFYPSVASGMVDRPPSLPPSSTCFFSLPLSLPSLLYLSLCLSISPSLCLSFWSEVLLTFVCLLWKDDACLFCPPPCSFIPPSAWRERDEKEECQQGF